MAPANLPIAGCSSLGQDLLRMYRQCKKVLIKLQGMPPKLRLPREFAVLRHTYGPSLVSKNSRSALQTDRVRCQLKHKIPALCAVLLPRAEVKTVNVAVPATKMQPTFGVLQYVLQFEAS